MSLIERLDKTDKTGRYYKCPVCGFGEVRVDNSVFYGKCNECNATMLDFVPAPHQLDFYLDNATYKMALGGFASGKTTICCFADAVHVMTVPHARLLITAPTLQQVREAILPELNRFIPPWLLVGGKPKGNPPVYDFTNGSEILIYASDDEVKIRSLNLTAFHIEEASGVPHAIPQILQTRLRNTAAVVFDEFGAEIGDCFMGLISTNPEDGWVKDEFLLKADKICGSSTADVSIYEPLRAQERIKDFAAFISTSFDNPYLPHGTIERISAGRSDRWKRKYLYSVLDTKEGVVYPELIKHYVEPFAIPDKWERLGGFDPGIADPTAMLFGAIDPNTNIVYVYNEYYVTDRPVGYHGEQLAPMIKPYHFLFPIQADPSVNQRSKETGKTYKHYFKNVTGIVLKEANNDLLFGIEKVRNYMYEGKLKIFNNLEHFRIEGGKYSFPKVKETGSTRDVPTDRDNHLMDCLRYMVSVLPQNPHQFNSVALPEEARKKAYSAFKQETPCTPDETHEKTVFVRDWGRHYGRDSTKTY